MSLKQLALALPLSLALLGLTFAPARADDDEPAPKKVRIKLKAKAVEAEVEPAPASPKSPMHVLRQWLMGKVGSTMARGGEAGSDALDAWFDGGSDVPLADLRDALKAEGWTAASMKLWLMGEVARGVPQMMRLFRMLDAPGQAAPRTFSWFGPQADPRQGGGFGQQAFPRWMRRGMRRGGRRFGPRAFHGQGRHGQGRHGQGSHGQGSRGQGAHGQGFGGRGGGAMGQPGAQPQQRAYILWNDGTGWQQRELPGGAARPGQGHGMPGRAGSPGLGGMPGMGGMPGSGPHGSRAPGGWIPDRAGEPGSPGGMGRAAPQPRKGRPARRSLKREGLDGQGLDPIRELLRGLEGLDGSGLDVATLRKVVEALKEQAAALRGPVPGRKVEVQLAPSGRVEGVEETETKEVGPGR